MEYYVSSKYTRNDGIEGHFGGTIDTDSEVYKKYEIKTISGLVDAVKEQNGLKVMIIMFISRNEL